MKPKLRRRIVHALEGALVNLLYYGFKATPLDLASRISGGVARHIGPLLPVSNIARDNLQRTMPELSATEREVIVRGVWDNLGRTFAEYPHLKQIMAERLEVVGAENLAAMRDDGQPGLCFSGHFANWEVMPLYGASVGCPLYILFRRANNPYIDRVLARARMGVMDYFVPKGAKGAKTALQLMRDNRHLGVLLDQKMNDGIEIPFFGIPAMTAPATAQLALKFNCPVVPAFVERLSGAYFRLTIEQPLPMPRGADRHTTIYQFTSEINQVLERWIRTAPAGWMWLHRRWPPSNPQP